MATRYSNQRQRSGLKGASKQVAERKGFRLDLSAIKATGASNKERLNFIESIPDNYQRILNEESPADEFRLKYRLNGILFFDTNLKSINARLIPLFGSVSRAQNQHERFMDVLKWILVNFDNTLRNYIESCGHSEFIEAPSISKIINGIDDNVAGSVVKSFYDWFHTFNNLVAILRMQDAAVKNFIDEFEKLNEDNKLLKEVLCQFSSGKGRNTTISIKKVYNVCRKKALDARDRGTMFPEESQGVHLSPKIQTFDKITMMPEIPLVVANSWCQTEELEQSESQVSIESSTASMYSMECQTIDVLTVDTMSGDNKPIPVYIEQDIQTDPIEFSDSSIQDLNGEFKSIDRGSSPTKSSQNTVAGGENEDSNDEIHDHLGSRLGSLASYDYLKSGGSISRSTLSLRSSNKSLNNEIELLFQALEDRDKTIFELRQTIESNENSWKDKIDSIESKLNQAERDKISLNETKSLLERNVERLQLDTRTLKDTIVSKEENERKLVKVNGQKEELVFEKTKEIDKWRSKCTELQQLKDLLYAEIEECKSTITGLDEKKNSLIDDQMKLSLHFKEEMSRLEESMSQEREKHEMEMKQMTDEYERKIGLLMKFPDAITQAAEFAKMSPIVLLSDENLQDLLKANTLRISLLESKNKEYRNEQIRRADLVSQMEEVDSKKVAALIKKNNTDEVDPGTQMLERMKQRIQSLARLQLQNELPHTKQNASKENLEDLSGSDSFEWLKSETQQEPKDPGSSTNYSNQNTGATFLVGQKIMSTRKTPKTSSRANDIYSIEAYKSAFHKTLTNTNRLVGLVNQNPARQPISYRKGTAKKYKHKTASTSSKWT